MKPETAIEILSVLAAVSLFASNHPVSACVCMLVAVLCELIKGDA